MHITYKNYNKTSYNKYFVVTVLFVHEQGYLELEFHKLEMGSLLAKEEINPSQIKEVDDIIKSEDVVMFSMQSCPYCVSAQNSLKEAKIPFKLVEATNNHMNVLSSKTGMSSMPNIWVKGVFVGGCNDGPESWMGIRPLIRNGEIFKMLAKKM